MNNPDKIAKWVYNDFVGNIKRHSYPAYYGRGTLMTRGAEEYYALNLNFDGTAYDVYPEYGTLTTAGDCVDTTATGFCKVGWPKDNFFTNPDLVSDTGENAWISGLAKWMMPSTPHDYANAVNSKWEE
jgi:hypothetical protein